MVVPYYGSSAPLFVCFRSSPDTSVGLSFGRPFQMGLPGSSIQTSTSLPDGTTALNINGQVVQRMPLDVKSAGLFYCEGSDGQNTTRVYSLIHSYARLFLPSDGPGTKTINKGESVVLSVATVSYNGNSGSYHRWARIRNGASSYLMSYDDQSSITIAPSEARHGDLYAVIKRTVSLSDNHFGMIRLIVRECVAGKWNPPACDGVCDLCYNGGVCDDKTGDCICPPGFMGPNCLTSCPSNSFGWNCEFRCGSSYLISNCQQARFGLPDPYGISCMTGRSGRSCSSYCGALRFGAGCTQTCHCALEYRGCSTYTGMCNYGGCAAGWTGTNCQVPDVCPVGYYGLNCVSKCRCSTNAACDRHTGYCSVGCAPGFTCVSIQCASGYFSDDCSRSCHCLNDAECDGLTGYCGGSDGVCASGFQKDENNYCFRAPVLSQPPTVTVTTSTASVSWEAWGSNSADTGDGPVAAYRVYYKWSSSWILASVVPVTNAPQVAYSFTIQSLQPGRMYWFSVAAVRPGQGGEGPKSPSISSQTLPLPPPSTTTHQTTTSVPSPTVDRLTPTSSTHSAEDEPTNNAQLSQVGYYNGIIVVVCVLVVVIIILVALDYWRFRNLNRNLHIKTTHAALEMSRYAQEQPQACYFNSAFDNKEFGAEHVSLSSRNSLASACTYEPVGLPPWTKPWVVPWSNLRIRIKVLGNGRFGKVRLCEVNRDATTSKAALKQLDLNATSADERQLFMDQYQTLARIRRHPNVMSMLAVCQHEDVFYVALEYLPNGDLLSHLKGIHSKNQSLPVDKMVQFALDIAKGMEHVADAGVIHRNLAAKNIFLGANLVAKVTGFSLSRKRDVYVEVSENKPRSPRWMALESLTIDRYTTKSDVWSFGVLMWEMTTLGKTPYAGFRTDNIVPRLKGGYRLPRPSNCEKEIYEVMLQCWQEDPKTRPTFKQLVKVMADRHTDSPYMDMTTSDA
ncbi:tyrosine-protein kinase receptor Tie-1-like [Patiria miniata]|uniref:Receptor protein-tyrosine kinase n=1 Tax=Patiria miniata TaxID=46514 RepID=A0A914AT55_PATMI|nr:tyrosine-protein kinase receptor Tie-1-like [Patiria miniata]